VEHQNEHRMEVRGSKRASLIELLDDPTGRRRWPDDLKARIVAESFQPGARVCVVSAKYGLIARHLSGWRRQALKGELVIPIDAAPAFVPLVIEPSISDIAAAAVGGTGEIRVEICCAVLHVAPDCSSERVYSCSTPHPMLQPITTRSQISAPWMITSGWRSL